MITESQRRRLLALSKIRVELHLTPHGNTCTDKVSLASLGVANGFRKREDFVGTGSRQEEHAIVIAENQVISTHDPISHGGRLERIRGTGVEPLRARWDRSQAEHRQSNCSHIGRIAMQSPDHHSSEPPSLGFQSHEIANAALVESPAVVDYQHVAGLGSYERFEEYIDAADVSNG